MFLVIKACWILVGLLLGKFKEMIGKRVRREKGKLRVGYF